MTETDSELTILSRTTVKVHVRPPRSYRYAPRLDEADIEAKRDDSMFVEEIELAVWRWGDAGRLIIGWLHQDYPTHMAYALDESFMRLHPVKQDWLLDAGQTCSERKILCADWNDAMSALGVPLVVPVDPSLTSEV